MKVELNKTSFINNELALITVECEDIENFSQIQIEIFDVATKNPASKLGFGNIPIKVSKNTYQVSFDTKLLSFGMYEIKFVIFHTLKDIEFSDNRKVFVSGEDFNRLFFEVIRENELAKTNQEIEKVILNKKEKNEDYFLSGIDIRTATNEQENNFAVFVFVKGLLTGIKSRLDRFEIFPFEGLDRNDYFVLVNEFLKSRTKLGLEFPYTQERQEDSRRENPVSVVHFPCIVTETEEQAYNYSFLKTLLVLQAFSLQRGASGEIFHTLILNLKTGKSTLLYPLSPYRGNLFTGNFAGEHPETLENYIAALEKDPFKNFLVSLHKEALAEQNMNFKYLRYWQILETLAESKKYKDGNGKDIKDSIKIVYQLLKEHKKNGNISESTDFNGKNYSQWDTVNMWIAFRNSVAHFGSIQEYSKLANKKNKEYAQIGIEIIQASNGHDSVLWNLKEDVKLILQRELNLA